MGLFNQTEKKKKKEQTDQAGKVQAVEPVQPASAQEEEPSGDADEENVQEESNVISTEDYLMRISGNGMEVLLTLYRSFSLEELKGLQIGRAHV